VEFSFTNSPIKTLAPGNRVLVVRNLAAFTNLYGSTLAIAGVFTNNTALDNGGELIKVEDSDNQTVLEFTYDDVAPWPTTPDGRGFSLVYIAPETKPDPKLATSWRSSALMNGNPGASDAIPFPADPAGDANTNGQPDLLDYAFGNDLGKPAILPVVSVQPIDSAGAFILKLSYPVSIAADRVKITALYSSDLATWLDASVILQQNATQQLGDGREILNWTVQAPPSNESRFYIKFRVDLL
jgi:hypothetical protein